MRINYHKLKQLINENLTYIADIQLIDRRTTLHYMPLCQVRRTEVIQPYEFKYIFVIRLSSRNSISPSAKSPEQWASF